MKHDLLQHEQLEQQKRQRQRQRQRKLKYRQQLKDDGQNICYSETPNEDPWSDSCRSHASSENYIIDTAGADDDTNTSSNTSFRDLFSKFRNIGEHEGVLKTYKIEKVVDKEHDDGFPTQKLPPQPTLKTSIEQTLTNLPKATAQSLPQIQDGRVINFLLSIGNSKTDHNYNKRDVSPPIDVDAFPTEIDRRRSKCDLFDTDSDMNLDSDSDSDADLIDNVSINRIRRMNKNDTDEFLHLHQRRGSLITKFAPDDSIDGGSTEPSPSLSPSISVMNDPIRRQPRSLPSPSLSTTNDSIDGQSMESSSPLSTTDGSIDGQPRETSPLVSINNDSINGQSMESSPPLSTTNGSIDGKLIETSPSLSATNDSIDGQSMEPSPPLSTTDGSIDGQPIETSPLVSINNDSIDGKSMEPSSSISVTENSIGFQSIGSIDNKSYFISATDNSIDGQSLSLTTADNSIDGQPMESSPLISATKNSIDGQSIGQPQSLSATDDSIDGQSMESSPSLSATDDSIDGQPMEIILPLSVSDDSIDGQSMQSSQSLPATDDSIDGEPIEPSSLKSTCNDIVDGSSLGPLPSIFTSHDSIDGQSMRSSSPALSAIDDSIDGQSIKSSPSLFASDDSIDGQSMESSPSLNASNDSIDGQSMIPSSPISASNNLVVDQSMGPSLSTPATDNSIDGHPMETSPSISTSDSSIDGQPMEPFPSLSATDNSIGGQSSLFKDGGPLPSIESRGNEGKKINEKMVRSLLIPSKNGDSMNSHLVSDKLSLPLSPACDRVNVTDTRIPPTTIREGTVDKTRMYYCTLEDDTCYKIKKKLSLDSSIDFSRFPENLVYGAAGLKNDKICFRKGSLLRIAESEVNSGSSDNSDDIEGSDDSFDSSDDECFFPTYQPKGTTCVLPALSGENDDIDANINFGNLLLSDVINQTLRKKLNVHMICTISELLKVATQTNHRDIKEIAGMVRSRLKGNKMLALLRMKHRRKNIFLENEEKTKQNHPSSKVDKKTEVKSSKCREINGQQLLLNNGEKGKNNHLRSKLNKRGEVISLDCRETTRLRKLDIVPDITTGESCKRKRTKTSFDPYFIQDYSVEQEKIKLPENLGAMEVIDSLTRIIYTENGKPVKFFSVINVANENIYDFKVDIRKSLIPNSGHGAFLTFVGSRILKQESKRLSKKFMRGRFALDVPTTRYLEYKTTDGMTSSLTIKGDNIHGNDNNPYFPLSRFPIYGKLENGVEFRVKIRGLNVHEDIDLLKERGELPSPKIGLGHLCIHSELDYVNDEMSFCSYDKGCGLIDLGRYGPFLKADRKTQIDFNMKDFIFDFEPAGWNFGVTEKLNGCDQVIDITDDRTGEPHQCAMDNIPMYVNEVGHNKGLVQNVLAREKDDRVVQYYLHAREPLKKGETVELLVNYTDSYEDTRVRKGYGKINIIHGVKGDVNDNERLKRNLSDRKIILQIIQDMDLEELEHSLLFIHTRTLKPIVSSTEWFASKFKMIKNEVDRERFIKIYQPPFRQWLARRRVYWLAEIFEIRLSQLRTYSKSFGKLERMWGILREMKMNSLEPMLPIFKSLNIAPNKSYLNAMVYEVIEEHLYIAAKNNLLIHAYDPSVWCKVARNLINNVLKYVATLVFVPSISMPSSLTTLLSRLYELAQDAALQIKRACRIVNNRNQSIKDVFEKGIDIIGLKPCAIHKRPEKDYFPCCYASLIGNASVVTVESSPSMISDANREKYQVEQGDIAISRLCEHNKPEQSLISFVAKCTEKKSKRQGYSQSSTDVAQIKEVTNSLFSGDVQSDEKFYTLWQVVRVVHVLATTCIPWKTFFGAESQHSSYSLDHLCEKVGVNIFEAKVMLSIKMPLKNDESLSMKKSNSQHSKI